ncbi:hypothetical protein Vafri_1184 [Volvox africanus]|nr:hypothetical protein Vafri_1184 [Volvox africanus]
MVTVRRLTLPAAPGVGAPSAAPEAATGAAANGGSSAAVVVSLSTLGTPNAVQRRGTWAGGGGVAVTTWKLSAGKVMPASEPWAMAEPGSEGGTDCSGGTHRRQPGLAPASTSPPTRAAVATAPGRRGGGG